MTDLELIPTVWEAARDEAFFRITARLLPVAVVDGGSSLLASYDDEPAVAPHAASEVAGARVRLRAPVRPPVVGRRTPASARDPHSGS